jgi:hypothetical protein
MRYRLGRIFIFTTVTSLVLGKLSQRRFRQSVDRAKGVRSESEFDQRRMNVR